MDASGIPDTAIQLNETKKVVVGVWGELHKLISHHHEKELSKILYEWFTQQRGHFPYLWIIHQPSLTPMNLFGLCNSLSPVCGIFQLMGYSLFISAHHNMCL